MANYPPPPKFPLALCAPAQHGSLPCPPRNDRFRQHRHTKNLRRRQELRLRVARRAIAEGRARYRIDRLTIPDPGLCLAVALPLPGPMAFDAKRDGGRNKTGCAE